MIDLLLSDPVFLSRLQFALTTMFHIIWPVLTIGLSVFIFVAESVWVGTGSTTCYRQARFWSRFFPLVFAMGVVSGIPLEFQFGTNWSRFSLATGDFLGQILSVEAMSGFMLESLFLYLMLSGWQRLSHRLHLFTTGMVTLGATISAFWIMVASSWMQTPAGGHMHNGVYEIDSRLAAIFNPDLLASFPHMWLACLTSTAFVIGGVSAWHLMRDRHADFFLCSFKAAVLAAAGLSLLQGLTGDLSGQSVARHQPAKLAAAEAHWRTNPPGTGAAWSILAWPDSAMETNRIELRVPYVLSILATHDPHGTVTGLASIPPDERPPIVPLFFSFRIMIIIGSLMMLVSLWALWHWYKGRLTPAHAPRQRTLLRFVLWLAPLSFVAVWAGWLMREVGRQPWILHGLIRTEAAASTLGAEEIRASLGYFLLSAGLMLVVFWVFGRRILQSGPATGPLPLGEPGGAA